MRNIANDIKHVSEHKTYTHTFLSWVIVQINYISNQSANQYDSYKKFFDKFPGVDFSNSVYESLKTIPVRIKSNDSLLTLKVDDRFIQIRIRGDIYKGFETSIMPYLRRVSSLFEDIEAEVTKFELRKVNLWGYKLNQSQASGYQGDSIIKVILSDSLNSEWNPVKSEVEEEEIQLTRLLGNEQISGCNCTLSAAYGFIQPLDPNSDIMSRVILDTQIESESKINGHDMPEILKIVNNRLFDMFHWAVSDNTINAML